MPDQIEETTQGTADVYCQGTDLRARSSVPEIRELQAEARGSKP